MKRTVNIVSSFNPLADQPCGRYFRFSPLKVFNFDNLLNLLYIISKVKMHNSLYRGPQLKIISFQREGD